MKETDKREVREKITTWSAYDFYDTIDGLIKKLKDFKREYSRYHRIEMDEDSCSGYYGDTYTEFILTGVRWETEEEVEKRVKIAKAERKKQREENKKKNVEKELEERRHLARLKEKYER